MIIPNIPIDLCKGFTSTEIPDTKAMPMANRGSAVLSNDLAPQDAGSNSDRDRIFCQQIWLPECVKNEEKNNNKK